MSEFRYNLEEGSKKYICPNCNQKRFVKYVDNISRNYLPDRFGRCERINSCGYWLKPEKEYSDYKLPEPIPEPPINFLPLSLVDKTLKEFDRNYFVQYLNTLSDEENVKTVIDRFKIGTSKHWEGSTVFWYIDDTKRVRSGKIMLYDRKTGKRAKNEHGNGIITSVRYAMNRPDLNLKQCLFGLHQVTNKTNLVGIVESEKTAIISSIFLPEYTWLATGSVSTFNHKHLFPLMNKTIVAFPDKNFFDTWSDRTEELNTIGYNITVSNLLEGSQLNEGEDIADLFINYKPQVRKPTIEEVLEDLEFWREIEDC